MIDLSLFCGFRTDCLEQIVLELTAFDDLVVLEHFKDSEILETQANIERSR